MISDISTQSRFSNSNADMGELLCLQAGDNSEALQCWGCCHCCHFCSQTWLSGNFHHHHDWFLNWLFPNYIETSWGALFGSFLNSWEKFSSRYQEMRCAIFLPTVDTGDTMSLKHISVTSRGAECIWFPSSFLCSFVQCRGNFRLQLAICPWVWSCTIDKIYYHVEKRVPFADVITWLSLGTRWQWVLFWFLGCRILVVFAKRKWVDWKPIYFFENIKFRLNWYLARSKKYIGERDCMHTAKWRNCNVGEQTDYIWVHPKPTAHWQFRINEA